MMYFLSVLVDWNSALMIIINGENDDHLEMLEGGVMRQLLDEKWKAFARVSTKSTPTPTNRSLPSPHNRK